MYITRIPIDQERLIASVFLGSRKISLRFQADNQNVGSAMVATSLAGTFSQSAMEGGGRMATGHLIRSKVYDGIQRIIHAWIGAVVVALVVLGWLGKSIEPGAAKLPINQAHIFLGYGLIVGLVARLVWAIVGPEHARFSALVHPVAWLRALRTFRLVQSHAFGHDAFASLAYLGLYGVLGVSVVSGLVLAAIKYDVGPLPSTLFDDFRMHAITAQFHDAVLYGATAFTVVHIGAMIVREKQRGYPIAQAMISGYQYRLKSPEDKENE